MAYDDGSMINPVTGVNGMTTERAAAVIVLGALGALIAIKMGFRGVKVAVS